MQVELIGCTSAGKSTLATAMAEAASLEGITMTLGDDIALKQIGARAVRKKSFRAALLHVVALIGCLMFSWRQIGFLRLSNKALKQSGISLSQRLNQLRKVLKQFGRYEIVSRRHSKSDIVLVDEGTVHVAHNIFVHETTDPHWDDIQAFAEIVPLSDLIVYLNVPEDVLIERTLLRGHSRIQNKERKATKKFVGRAVTTFDQLSQHERIAARLVTVHEGHIVPNSNLSENPITESFLRILSQALKSLQEQKSAIASTETNSMEVVSS